MKKPNGFSLVELVLVIVVVGISLPGVIFTFNELAKRSVHEEALTTTTMLAEGELERVAQKNFANVVDEHRDSPEQFSGDFTGYSWQIRVDPIPVELANDPGMAQYKQVEVRVTNSIIGDVSLKTIITDID